ncbi:hypothetical protein E2C01_087008 [Portunus trituberculatus]|uniref:Uncharacterized protein n=1 Tax=Portunus trituberculatus TaxID=210409 RepID=A0A5B7J708_PORTR|nr:hypothetical protein [Portunus trituberculatus]
MDPPKTRYKTTSETCTEKTRKYHHHHNHYPFLTDSDLSNREQRRLRLYQRQLLGGAVATSAVKILNV